MEDSDLSRRALRPNLAAGASGYYFRVHAAVLLRGEFRMKFGAAGEVPKPAGDSFRRDFLLYDVFDAVLAEYEVVQGEYGDGAPFMLRRPVYAFEGTAPEHFSVRLAPVYPSV